MFQYNLNRIIEINMKFFVDLTLFFSRLNKKVCMKKGRKKEMTNV